MTELYGTIPLDFTRAVAYIGGMKTKNETRAVGQKVTCNGYPGTITEVCTGQLSGMVVVRLASGSVCVDATEAKEDR